MARLRRFGGGLQDVGVTLMRHVLALQEQEEQSALVGARQTLQQVLGDPTGGVAQRLKKAGETQWGAFVPSGEEAVSTVGAKIGSMERKNLPTDVGTEELLRVTPGGEDSAKDPRAVKYLIDQKGAREGMLARNAATEATEAGATSQAAAHGQQTGTNLAQHENAPVAVADEVAKTNALTPALVNRAGKVRAAEVAAELVKAKAEIDYRLAAEGRAADMKQLRTLTQGATEAVLGLEELSTLALEVNHDFPEGSIDVYSGLRNAAAQLPLIGPALSGTMSSMGALGDRLATGDTSIPRKVNQLEAMRWQMGIKLIRAAGDPRPSNADVQGVIGMIPGSYESKQATEQKIGFMQDLVVMLPQVMYANPGLTGKPLLDLAIEESKKRSGARQLDQNRDVHQVVDPNAPKLQRQTPAGGTTAPPAAQVKPQRLRLMPNGEWR